MTVCYLFGMSTVYDFPVSKLPEELKNGLSEDALVTVTISEGVPLPEFTDAQYEELFGESFRQKAQGEGTVCETKEDINEYFDKLRANVDAKYAKR